MDKIKFELQKNKQSKNEKIEQIKNSEKNSSNISEKTEKDEQSTLLAGEVFWSIEKSERCPKNK